MPKIKRAVWFQAVRTFSFTASIIPVLIGGAEAMNFPGRKMWMNFPLFLVSAVLFHAATNLVNDYYDYLKGVDKQGSLGSSGVLVAGLLKPAQVRQGAVVLFAAGVVVGLPLIFSLGLPILILGIVGMAGGYFYTAQPIGYKYFALGDFFVFILMGVLLVLGAFFAVTGTMTFGILAISLPIGALVTAILNANNLRDYLYDTRAGVKTFAGFLGPRGAKIEYHILILFAYLSVAVMIMAKVLSPWAWVVFMSLPLAWKNLRQIQTSRTMEPGKMAFLDVETAKLHFLFGVLMAAAIVVKALLP